MRNEVERATAAAILAVITLAPLSVVLSFSAGPTAYDGEISNQQRRLGLAVPEKGAATYDSSIVSVSEGAVSAPKPRTGPPDWFSEVTTGVVQHEYSITWQNESALSPAPPAYLAPNRAQGFRTHFYPDGIRVVPRGENTSGWFFGLDLTSFGRERQPAPVLKGTLSPLGNRIEYDRGDLIEWYENSLEGLKHGFTLVAPPAGSGIVVIRATVNGNLRGELGIEGNAINFRAPEGGIPVLRYEALSVFDAQGRELPAWLELRGEHLQILLSDQGAAYPLMVDPLLTSPSWTAESDQAASRFGWSVASAGDVNGDGYDDVIVGAYLFDNGETDEGRAFVYHGSATGLSTIPNWTAESDQPNARFGISVASAGDVNGDGYDDVIVGAYLFDNAETDEGRAFVYHGSGSGLFPAAAWTKESNQNFARFGWSVASAGDVNGDGYDDVIVGAYLFDNGETDEGRAFVYHGSALGLPAIADWTSEGDQSNSRFGISVASAGDVNGDGYDDVIVGANGFDAGQTDEGRAFVFRGSATGLSTIPSWTAESDQASAGFGVSVAPAGDVNGDSYDDVIVGANLYDNPETDEGGAFVHHGSAEGLSAAADWTAEGDQVEARFGNSVAGAGDVDGNGYDEVIVGANLYDNGEANEGSVFAYHGSEMGPSSSANWTAESNLAEADFGISVATAGDVNGDGYNDVIVGADLYDNGQTDEGRTFVYHAAKPVLEYTPATLDFGTVAPGFTGSDAFQIRNNGTGTLSYAITESASWITDISPSSGDSMGEWDTITVSIDTTSLADGSYSTPVSISSNGGNGTVTADVTVQTPPNPILEYAPTSIDFGTVTPGFTGSDTFQVWNNGTGTLSYDLTESTSWIVSVTPANGTSTGERDTITVGIDTTGLAEGSYSASISITSNGGSEMLLAKVTITAKEPFEFLLQSISGLSVAQGKSATRTVQVTLTSGEAQTVHLSLTGLPTGSTHSFAPTSGTPPFSSDLTISAGGDTQPRTYPLTLKATGGGKTESTTFSLTVIEDSSTEGSLVSTLLSPPIIAAIIGVIGSIVVAIITAMLRKPKAEELPPTPVEERSW